MFAVRRTIRVICVDPRSGPGIGSIIPCVDNANTTSRIGKSFLSEIALKN